MARTLRSDNPVMVAICASVDSALASRVNRRAPQIVECHANYASTLASLAPRGAEAVIGPRLAVEIGQDDR